MHRHWSTLYDALRHGRFDLDTLRPLLVQTARTAAPYRVAGHRVVVIDHSGYPRPAARTVAERERYHGPNASRPVGHRYSWLSQVVDREAAWLAPLDVERIGPEATPVGTAFGQLRRVVRESDEPVLAVGDREYGVDELLTLFAEQPAGKLSCVVRVRSNLVFYVPPPPGSQGRRGPRASTGRGCNSMTRPVGRSPTGTPGSRGRRVSVSNCGAGRTGGGAGSRPNPCG